MPVRRETIRSESVRSKKKVARVFRKRVAKITGVRHFFGKTEAAFGGEEQPKPLPKKVVAAAVVVVKEEEEVLPPPPTTIKKEVDSKINNKEAPVHEEKEESSLRFLSAEEEEEEEEVVGAIAVDCGSHGTRVGAAGSDSPSVECLSIVGTRKTAMADGLLPDVSFGEDAERASAAYDLAIPVEKSLVVDWDGAEKLWKHAIGLSGFRSSRIIVTTGVLAPKATRERLVRTCAAMGFADVHCGVAPVLALFGAGYTTGCVVDCGLESSRVVPVYDGYALPHAIVVDPSLGGLSVDAHAARILETAGLAFRNNEAALRAGEVLKIRAATVGIPEAGTTVELPLKCLAASSRHRQVVEIGVDERAAMGETLFVPQVANRSIESPGLAGVVLAAVTKCSIDLRRAMYEGIFLVGGGSLIPGLPERLDVDLNHLAAANVDVQVTALENRKFAAFLGASVVADLPDFASNWISREDAEDDVALAARLDQTSYNC